MRRIIHVPVSERWAAVLAGMPETGMGFHLVDVVLEDGRRVERVPIYDSRTVELPAEVGAICPDDIVDLSLSRTQGPSRGKGGR